MKNTILANRLADITSMAYSGQSLNIRKLADKYEVCTKTIRRDFERLGAVIERSSETGDYLLATTVRTVFNEQDLVRLIGDMGLKKVFPLKAAKFLRNFISDQTSHCYHFQEQPLEADFINSLHTVFESAIHNQRQVSFLYKGKSRIVSPYMMVYSHGSWYLAAIDSNVLKAFSLARIKFVTQQKSHFIYDESIVREIKAQDTIWFGLPLFTVTVEISPDIAFFFERKALLPKQELLEKKSDGTLLLSASAWSYNQITPVIQYWLPNIRVISPIELNAHIRKNLMDWLGLPLTLRPPFNDK
jgi:predicted DNA-binding transcriptional regulator YafY